jgi:hypothetical protein
MESFKNSPATDIARDGNLSKNSNPGDRVKSIDDRTIHEKFDDKPIQRLVNKVLQNQRVKKEYDRIKECMEAGVSPVDIGSKSSHLSGNKVLIKGRHGRYVIEVFENDIHVLGIGVRGNTQNIKTFEKLMNKIYKVNLTGY